MTSVLCSDNITAEREWLGNDNSTLRERYEYDAKGQLTRENNQAAGKTWVYAYDNGGNITSKTEYAYTTGTPGTATSTKSYTYGDSTWKDLLTGYNGATLTYDAIGNLTSDGTWTYTWQHGRQLAGMSNGTKSLTFAYNADGKRVAKTYVNGEDTTEVQYYYAGNQLAKMTRGDKTLVFTYDSLGPRSVVYNGTNYYYLRNAQGDILGIVSAYGAVVTSYTYDAWGNVLSVTGSMSGTLGTLNPLRYRGYVYDTETKLYYLNTRYYNPATGRFINADIFVSTGQGVLGSNMFAYCGNNPVMGYDPSGTFSFGTLFSGVSLLSIGITACAVAAAAVTAGACLPLLLAATATFTAGGITVLNGASEVVESFTDYNVMRDGYYGGDRAYYEAQRDTFSTVATVGTMVTSAGMASGNVCFIAGTLVQTEDGPKSIEEVQPGDRVWAWNEETGEVSLKPVVETYINEADELMHVHVNGEEIVTTPGHPFYSPVKGWTSAVQLRAGDILVLVNGEYVIVEQVQHEILEAPVKVYNFNVEDYHTYYVTNSGVLVHNSCGNTPAAQRGQQVHKSWDYGPTVKKEVTIGPGARVDGLDQINHIVYELKPNNPRAIRQGLRQLDRYLSILGEEKWAGVLMLYE